MDVGLLDDLLGFGGRQYGLRQPRAKPWQFEFARWIVQDVMLPRHPFEPHAQRHDAAVLAGEAQRLAVLLAVVEHMALIAFEHCARYFHWLCEAALVAP